MAEWEFELEGMTVRPGQMLHVAPDYHQRAGAAGRAERYDGAGAVMLRSDNGAVPWVPVHALSWQPHPETVAMEEMRRVGIERPGRRDVGLWLLARSYGVREGGSLWDEIQRISEFANAAMHLPAPDQRNNLEDIAQRLADLLRQRTDGVPTQNTDPAGRADWVGKPGASLHHESPSGGNGEAAGATRQAGETPVTTVRGVREVPRG